jgi:hypothetical protein
LQAFGQALAVHFRVAGQGDVLLRLAALVDQFQTDAGLLHLTGLAHLGVVEAHEGRRLGGCSWVNCSGSRRASRSPATRA